MSRELRSRMRRERPFGFAADVARTVFRTNAAQRTAHPAFLSSASFVDGRSNACPPRLFPSFSAEGVTVELFTNA